MAKTREQLGQDVANALNSGAPVQLFGPRGAGKLWVAERGIERAASPNAMRADIRLDGWASGSPDEFEASLGRILAKQLGSAGAPLEAGFQRSDKTLIAVLHTSSPYFATPTGQAAYQTLERWTRRVANRQLPWNQLRLVVLTHVPFVAAALVGEFDPYGLARTQVVECEPTLPADWPAIVAGTRAEGAWGDDALAYINAHAAGGHPLVLRRLAETGRRHPGDVVNEAALAEGPLGYFLTQIRDAASQRPGGVQLLRRLVSANGEVEASPEDRAFLASWGLVAWLGPKYALGHAIPAIGRYVRETFGAA